VSEVYDRPRWLSSARARNGAAKCDRDLATEVLEFDHQFGREWVTRREWCDRNIGETLMDTAARRWLRIKKRLRDRSREAGGPLYEERKELRLAIRSGELHEVLEFRLLPLALAWAEDVLARARQLPADEVDQIEAEGPQWTTEGLEAFFAEAA